MLSRVDKFYFGRSIQNHNAEIGIAVIVKVPKSSLYADENIIQDTLTNRDDALLKSLQFGVARHVGDIPTDYILSIYNQTGTRIQ